MTGIDGDDGAFSLNNDALTMDEFVDVIIGGSGDLIVAAATAATVRLGCTDDDV